MWIARGKNSSHGTLQAFNAALRHEPFSSHYSTMLCARALSKSLGLLALDDSPSGVAVGKEAGGLHEFAWSSVALRSPPAQWFLSAFRLALALVRRKRRICWWRADRRRWRLSSMRRRFTIGRESMSAAISAPALPTPRGATRLPDNTFNKTGFIGGGQIGAN